MKILGGIVGAAGLVVLAACSGSANTVTHTVERTVTAAGPTVTVTRAPTAPSSSTAAAPAEYRIGQTFAIPASFYLGGGKATVLGFRDSGVGQSGRGVFHDLHVRVCAAHKGTISSGPWSLIGSDDSNNATIVSGGGLREPQYPSGDGEPVQAGECVSGWITFETAGSVKIVAAKYALQDPDTNTSVQAKWRLR